MTTSLIIALGTLLISNVIWYVFVSHVQRVTSEVAFQQALHVAQYKVAHKRISRKLRASFNSDTVEGILAVASDPAACDEIQRLVKQMTGIDIEVIGDQSA